MRFKSRHEEQGFDEMKRHFFLKAVNLCIAGVLIPGHACYPMPLEGNRARDKPNIIVIMADDMGFSDLGCYGSESATPNLDRLANNGLRFTHFYNNAKCTPSRTSLMTGLYPRQPQQVADDKMGNSANIAQVLKSAGYRTLMTGKKGGIEGLPTEKGFDRFYGLNDDGACNYFNPVLKRPGENEPGRKSPDEQRAWAIDGKVIQRRCGSPRWSTARL